MPLSEESRKLTAFSVLKGHYEFTRIPFGLSGVPITFTRLVNTVFHGMLGKNVYIIVYIDDTLVATGSIGKHLEVLREILRRLGVADLKVKLAKCDFLKKNIVYLGHVISKEGVRMNDEMVRAIANFPTPMNKKSTHSFIGMAGIFRRFVRGFSTLSTPLIEILRDVVQFSLNEAQRVAFQKAKEALISPPVLKFPDFSLAFMLLTDVNQEGVGACLMQKSEGKFHPIAFYSKKYKTRGSNERLMTMEDKEAFAVVFSLVHCKMLLLGNEVEVLTDHKPLLDLFNKPDLSPKRARWFLTIRDFGTKLKYIEGKHNVVADVLSGHFGDTEDKHVCSASGEHVRGAKKTSR